MEHKLNLSILVCSLSLLTFGQEAKITPSAEMKKVGNAGKKSELIHATLKQEINHTTPKTERWAISVRPRSSRNHFSPEIQQLKEEKYAEKMKAYRPNEEVVLKSSVATPVVGQNYEGNWSVAGAPPDNSMAVSNGGFVVSCNNDGAVYFNASGTMQYAEYWYDFFGDPNYTSMLYDPKIIYDSQADRFVLIVLHGSTPSTSQVIVSFSKSNNPNDGWWVYTLTGNPLSNNSWFDYPNLGVSNDELFVTGNLFSSSNTFNESVIYQIPKAAGYAGTNFSWSYWSDLDATNGTAFTLVPATNGHQGNYGPGLYFMSSISGGASNTILWDLTDNLSGNPQLDSYSVNSGSYQPAANANQQGSSETLSNGDCRMQGAFYLNGLIHYVFHADVGSSWNGIKYNRLNLSNGSNSGSSFGQAGTHDLSYPALASFATSATDKSVMIGFLRSSPSIFAEIRVVNCDDNMNWSNSVLVKSGEATIDFLSGDERWGDYSGMSRKHNSPTPKVWMAGCYGANIPPAGVNNSYKTWIAEISGNPTNAIEEQENQLPVKIYPVPTYDLMNIEFETQDRSEITIEILDLEGKVVRLIYKDVPKMGLNKLIFNKEALSSGTYFVHIYSSSQTLKNEKIIVLD